ncbi:MAG: hypothetical protein KIT09_03285 [Bryobacteraceae bacterium]|nr:hypothetical protein [Bryobacteraceae bacterium]
MTIARRRLLQGLALAGSAQTGTHAQAPAPALTIDALGAVSRFHGIDLNRERLEILKPVLERRLKQLETLRNVDFDDSVGPTQGILK